MQRSGISTVFQQFSGTQVSVENDRAAVILILLCLLLPACSPLMKHTAVPQRGRKTFAALVAYFSCQITRFIHSGISNAPTQEQLQDTAEKVK